MKKIKASEIFEKDEIEEIKQIIDIFNGSIVKVVDKNMNVLFKSKLCY